MREVDVAVRYSLGVTDKGVKQAIGLTQDYARVTRSTTAQVDASLRANSRMWLETARVARTADRQVTDQVVKSSSNVNRSLESTVVKLRRSGVAYKEIATAAKGWGVTAQETAVAVEKAAAKEIAAIDRVAAARNRLRNMVGLGPRGGGMGGREATGLEHGAMRAGAGRLRSGASFLGAGLIGGLAGYASVQGIKDAVTQTRELAKETRYLTQVTGMDTKTAAAWVAVAKSRDISTGALNVGLRTLSKVATTALTSTAQTAQKAAEHTYGTMSKQAEAALTGNKKVIGAFHELGISVQDVGKHQRNVAGLTQLVTTRLDKMKDGVNKTTLANTLLGKSSGHVATAAAAFAKLGISEQQLKAHSHDLNGLLGLVADRLNKIPGGAQKAALEAQLFGRNAAALQPILQEGSKGMEEMRLKAQAYGVTLGGDPIKNQKKLEEASYNLKLAQIGLQVQFSEHVAPALIKVTMLGIKLFGVLRRDLGPTFHWIGGEIKDASHWLKEHKDVLHAVEIGVTGVVVALAGLKVLSTIVRVVRGVTSDFRAVGGAVRSVIGLFSTQESESVALAKQQAALGEANLRLAGSFDAVAVSSKAAAEGEALAGEAGGIAGGVPLGGVGAGAKAATTAEVAGGTAAAEKVGMAAETEISQSGIMGMLLGRQGAQSLTSKLSGLGGTLLKGAGIAGMGVMGAQMIGGMIGGGTGRKVSTIGTGAALGAGLGSMLPGVGTLAGGALGGAVAAARALFAGPSVGDAEKKLQQQMNQAAQSGNWQRLQQLSASAGQFAKKLDGLGSATDVRTFQRLRDASANAATALERAHAGQVIGGMTQAQGASRFSSVGAQLATITPSLNKLQGQFQNAGALSAIKFAYGLQQQGRLPRGATDRLIKDLEAKYPPLAMYLQQQGATSMQQLADTIRVNKVTRASQDLIGQIHDTFGWLPVYTQTAGKNSAQKLQTAEGELKQIMQTGTQAQKDAAAPLLAQLVKLHGDAMDAIKQKTHDDTAAARGEIQKLGGSWSSLGSVVQTIVSKEIIPGLNSVFTGLGNLIPQLNSVNTGFANLGTASAPPAVAAPGHKRQGGYVVPGDPTVDGTLILASGNEVVLTGPGQHMMDSYAPGLLDHVIGHQLPHFSGGGRVFRGAVSTFGPPGEPAGTTAYGGTDAVPGIAINPGPGTGDWNSALAQSLRGKLFTVSIGAHSAQLPVVDKGPSATAASGPYAGHVRTIDITGLGAQRMGFSVGAGGSGFPTDAAGIATEAGGQAASSPAGGSGTRKTTTFAALGKGLHDGFDLGYEYGLDPTQSGLTSPSAALRDAIRGASLKAVHHSAHTAARGGSSTSTATGNVGRVQAAMLAAANRIIGKPYGHTGGHVSWDASDYDCSGAAGYVLHAAGLQPGFGWTGSDVSWGLPGPGKYITRGIRNANSSLQGHEMLNFFGRYLESGGGGPYGQPRVHWDPGWDGTFTDFRHPPGFRRGGHVNQARLGNANEADFHRGRTRRPFAMRAGGHVNHHHTRPIRSRPAVPGGLHIGSGGHLALPSLPSDMRYSEISSLEQALKMMPVEAVNIGARTSRAALLRVIRSLQTITTSTSDAKIHKAFDELAATLSNVKHLSYATLQHTATALQRRLRGLTETAHPNWMLDHSTRRRSRTRDHAGAPHITYTAKNLTTGEQREATRLRNALQLVNYQMGLRTGTLVRAAENQAAALQNAQTRLQRLMDRKGIDQASAQGALMLERYEDRSVKVLKNTVAKLQKAYKMAVKAGNKKAAADIGQKLTDALDQLDQAVTDKIVAHRNRIEAAAQAVVDKATHRESLVSAGEQALQLQQQLHGTSGTPGGAAQLSAYIKTQIVPALQGELGALQKQEAVAKKAGDTTLADQIAEAIAGKQNDILQAQLDAQNAIKDAAQQTAQNTDTSGTLAVSYQGQTLPDLAGALNGA